MTNPPLVVMMTSYGSVESAPFSIDQNLHKQRTLIVTRTNLFKGDFKRIRHVGTVGNKQSSSVQEHLICPIWPDYSPVFSNVYTVQP
ncbi:MAG: hypothetical protein M2R45_00084 [Verrucomicrobia subdivision 3 bacterium]|nr:hypothetical protein [Limisphaerales bacterium]MCS1412458.1 hypothetical protein [Limisphaerales bacterium]